jgi:hypothetical protein
MPNHCQHLDSPYFSLPTTFKQLWLWCAGAGGEAGLVAGVSRAYSRPAQHQEEQEDSTSAADDTSLEDLMAQMKSI